MSKGLEILNEIKKSILVYFSLVGGQRHTPRRLRNFITKNYVELIISLRFDFSRANFVLGVFRTRCSCWARVFLMITFNDNLFTRYCSLTSISLNKNKFYLVLDYGTWNVQPAASSSSAYIDSKRKMIRRSEISQETKNEIVADFIIGCFCHFKGRKICKHR